MPADEREDWARLLVDRGDVADLGTARAMMSNPRNWPDDEE